MIRSEFSQFFVMHGQSIVAGPYQSRGGARSFVTTTRKCRDRRLKNGLYLTKEQENLDAYEITEARYVLTGKTLHAAKAG